MSAQKGPLVDDRDYVVFIYDARQVDDWLCAWVFRDAAKRLKIPVIFAKRGDPTPLDLTDRNILEIEEGPNPPGEWRSRLVVSRIASPGDGHAIHPESWKRPRWFGIESLVADGKMAVVPATEFSRALTLWRFLNDKKDPPLLLTHASAASDDHLISKAILAAIESYEPLDFKVVDALIEACDDRVKREKLLIAGEAVLRERERRNRLG